MQRDRLMGGPSRTLRRLLADKRVDSISDERSSGDGFWIYMAPGWWDPTREVHNCHKDGMHATIAAFKASVAECACNECAKQQELRDL